jgi:hypothetical protein
LRKNDLATPIFHDSPCGSGGLETRLEIEGRWRLSSRRASLFHG